MRTALERHAALLVLGAGGVLLAVCMLLSAGSSNGRLVWIGLFALVLAAAAATAALLGLPRPAPGREAWVALGLLAAFVVWCGISVLWSIEPDRSWDYLNRGLVYVGLAVVGLALGAYVSARSWAFVLSGVVAAALGLGGAAGAAVAVWAFSRPGLANDLQPHAARVHDGAWFTVLFVLAAAAVGALAYLGSLLEEHRPLSVERRRLVGRTV